MNRRVAQERAGSGGFPRGDVWVLWGEAGRSGREEASVGSAIPTSP